MTALTVVISVVTITVAQLLARKRWEGWVLGLANQVLWLAFTIKTGAWGLLLLTGALVVTNTQGLVRWRRDVDMQARLSGEEPVDASFTAPFVAVVGMVLAVGFVALWLEQAA